MGVGQGVAVGEGFTWLRSSKRVSDPRGIITPGKGWDKGLAGARQVHMKNECYGLGIMGMR